MLSQLLKLLANPELASFRIRWNVRWGENDLRLQVDTTINSHKSLHTYVTVVLTPALSLVAPLFFLHLLPSPSSHRANRRLTVAECIKIHRGLMQTVGFIVL